MIERGRVGQRLLVKLQGRHRQLTIKAGDWLEEVTVKVVQLQFNKSKNKRDIAFCAEAKFYREVTS